MIRCISLHFLSLALYVVRSYDRVYKSRPSDTAAVVIFVVYETVVATTCVHLTGDEGFSTFLVNTRMVLHLDWDSLGGLLFDITICA